MTKRSRKRGEFKAVVEERDKGLQSQIAKQADIEQGLKTERDRAVAEVGELKTTIEGLTRSRPDPEAHSTSQLVKRWLSPVAVGALLLAAVLGGTLVSVWRSPDSGGERWADQATAALAASDAARQTAEAQAADADKAREKAEAKSASASAALTKSEQARQAAEAKVDEVVTALAKSEQARQAAETKAADAEKARQAAAARADDVDKARQAASARAEDADRTRRAAEAKAADADKARQAADTKADQATAALSKSEQARQAAETKAADAEKARQAAAARADDVDKARQASSAKATQTAGNEFTISPDTDVNGRAFEGRGSESMDQCLQRCANMPTCRAFTFYSTACWLYASGTFSRRSGFVSGRR